MESNYATECGTECGRPPLSPLPSTLRCCPRDDTVCTYCGVSYLVLHEIADLEAKILLLEKNQDGDGEVEWARGALQAACQALVQRELSSARASAESRIQALAEVYDQEREESREQQRQVLERSRALWEATHGLAERLFTSVEAGDGGGGSGGGMSALEYLDGASRCMAALDSTLRSSSVTAEELQSALRRARQAETDLVQARVQTALRRLESNAQRSSEERQALADALQKAR
ncbi:uncharacterized protein LOC113217456 [Frankliniella occidentalis]|uniref:Uncharacterized protein LOC113217456 n=1 Tax=Frankliniella occidentalis TaxID=133901 RepID=A0A9C6UB27_FRAOC|nr:uncharacterized protein LOC113217456 [Frankliniella occidentalis]